MSRRFALLVSAIALCGVPHTYGASQHDAGVPLGTITKEFLQGENAYPNKPNDYAGVWILRPRNAAPYFNFLATSSVILVTLFAILQCVAYIYKGSQPYTRSERRLASGGSCGENVSASRCLL